MSYSPTGPIERVAPIEIKFDRPVVYQHAIGAPIDAPAATAKVAAVDGIAIAWKGFWKDAQTLSIEPTQALAPSTRYHVELAGDLARRTAGFHFELVYRPLAVEGLWGVATDELAPGAALPLSFNQPVRPADVTAHCRLTDTVTTAKRAIALTTSATTPATSIPLVPAQALTPGAAYTLGCDGLTGAGGDAPLDKPYTLAIRARPDAAVTGMSPSGDDVSADQATLEFTFATPVALDLARKAIASQPAIPGLGDGYLSNDNKTYQVTVDLETQTRYQLTIDHLVDTYGQVAKPATFAFKTGDAQPRLSMQRGIFALEASAKGFPIWTRNVDKYSVECAAIPASKLVRLLTTDMNYDPWGGNDDDKPVDWAGLGVKPRTAARSQTARNKWMLDEVDLGASCGGGKRGVFLAEVSSDVAIATPGQWTPRKNRVLANVTDLGVLLEVGTSSGIVWVTSLSTGATVAGAGVKIFTPAGKQVFDGTTDADGLLAIPASAILKAQKPRGADPEADHDWDNYRSQRLIAVIEHAGDTAVVDGNWSNGIQTWNFGVREDRSGGTTWIRGFVQSDRGLYRPGETVHFKGIAREIAQGRAPRIPVTPGGNRAPVAIEVTDSRNQVVLDTKRALSGFGGFAFDLALGPEAALGDYYVAATIAGQTFRERFSVEEFRAATFELGLRGTVAHPQPGDRLGFALDARYLFGAPLGHAKVEWTLRKRDHVVQFEGWDDYTFASTGRRWWWHGREDDDYGAQIADGTGETDDHGQLAIEARDDASTGDSANPVDYILSSTVTDATDQTMSKSVVVAAHRTQFYLGLHANEFVQAVGMPFGVNLVALDPDGKRVATKAHLAVVRTVNHCTWTAVHGRGYPQCEAKDEIAMERDIDLAAGGSHTERIVPTAPGDYQIKVTAKDGNGCEVATSSELWVIGKGEAFWSGDEGARMTVVAGKPSYQPGETAKLVAQANLVRPTALITIERDGVIDAHVQRLASASEGVALTIADAWAPNVFARVSMVAGRHGAGDANRPMFKMGLVELTVASSHKQLDVQVTLDRDRVRPGDKVSGKITVTQNGAPVAAEVSLSAADEGILQLIAYQTPNPMKTFYAPYGLGVDAGTNWNRIARLADPESSDPDQGGDSASSNDTQRVRSKFVASAFWAPMLVTDARGEIAFAFTAPDNLTAFRLMAVAADAVDRFGAGELRLTVDKPVMATPALPRFLRGGDAATVGVVVHNHTDRAGRATVTAKAVGATLDAGAQTVEVAAHGSARVRFAAKAGDAKEASFEFAVALGGDRDALRVAVPIDRPRQLEHRLLVDRALAGHDTWSAALDVTSDVIRDDSALAITIDTSGVGDLAPALRGLIEYPYGCLEQTMSRFIPLVAAKDLARTLDDPSLQGTRANQFIAAGIAKVIRHQQGDGLFSLWPQSQTYPHLAAYALWGLTVAEQAGESVPHDVFDKGVPALQQWASTAAMKPDGDAATMAMAAYVMALRGKPDAALMARLYDIRTALPRWGQAFLLRAMAIGKAARSQVTELEQLIVATTKIEDGVAMVHETIPGYEYELYMASDIRATAMTLAALLDVDPASPLIAPLVAGLKASRNQTGGWRSTQDNLWSLVALAAYGRRAAQGDVTAKITVGGKVVATKHFARQPSWTFHAKLSELAGDRLEVTSDRPAHVTARLTEARLDAGEAVANGFTLARQYLDEHGAPLTLFQAGQLVTVQLDVTAAAAHHWVALVDPLPAGFEAQNPKLASGGAAPQPTPTASGWRTALTWAHQDLRDDRVEWFADDMPAGSYRLTYTARATIDGSFTAMPATVEAMYQPEQRARTARVAVSIAK